MLVVENEWRLSNREEVGCMNASARCLDLISVVTISLTAWETGNGVKLRLAAKIREAERCVTTDLPYLTYA